MKVNQSSSNSQSDKQSSLSNESIDSDNNNSNNHGTNSMNNIVAPQPKLKILPSKLKTRKQINKKIIIKLPS